MNRLNRLEFEDVMNRGAQNRKTASIHDYIDQL